MLQTTSRDPLGSATENRRRTRWVLALGGVTLLIAIAAVGSGAIGISPGTSVRILAHQVLGWPAQATWSPTEQTILWGVRLPRVVLGLAVGAGLAVCGAALQAMVRNVLADPYLLGINSGASCGAAAAILFGVGAGLGPYALTGSAFLGALGAALLVLVVASSSGMVTSIRLVLAGVAVGYALSAATSFLIFASGSAEGSRSVMFWLLGSLGLARWGVELALVVGIVLVTILVLTAWSAQLDALAVGDDTARSLGISPEGLRVRLIVVVSLCVGVAVAAAGSIGFVGLVVPHLARRLVGATHRWVIPVSALLGGGLLVLADLVARTVMSPQELPIGIITALVGAPFLLFLLRRMQPTP